MTFNLNEYPGRGNEASGSGSSANRGGMQDQEDINMTNPQRGNEWNNYQTRELSDNEKGNISAEEAAQAFDDEDE